MGATIRHELTATTPDDPAYEIRPSHWNAALLVTLSLVASEVFGAFSNANGISFGVDGEHITASHNGLTTARASNDGVGLAAAQSNVTWTVNSAGISMDARGYAGTALQTTSTNGTDIKATLNSAGLTLAVPPYLTAAEGAPGGAGTGFTTTTVGGAVVAGTLNSDGLLLAVPAYLTTAQPPGAYLTTARASNDAVGLGTAQTNVTWTVNSAGISLNAAGYAGVGATTATTAGVELKVTHATNGLSMGVPAWLTTAQPVGAYLTTARGSTDAIGLNTAQTNVTWTVNSSGLSINAGGYAGTGVTTVTTAGSELKATLNNGGLNLGVPAWLTAAGGPGGGATVSVVEIADGGRLTTCAQWNNATYSNRPIFVPFEIDNNLTGCHTIRLFASRSSGTLLVATFHAGIYSRVNATSASLISSTSMNISVSTSAQYSGVRIYDITGLSGLSLPPGRYLLGVKMSVAATNSGPLHLMGGDQIPIAGFVLPGTNSTAATATNSHIIPMWGVYTAVSADLPANVNNTQISGGNSVNSPDVYALIKAI